MDTEKQSPEVQPVPSNVTRTGEHVEPLAGLTEAVPDTRHKYADQPTEEVMPTAVGQLVPVQVVIPAQRQRLTFLRTLLSSPKSRFGAGIVLVFILAALLAPIITPGDPNEFVAAPGIGPTTEHLFGIDTQGRDVFRETVWGARLSLLVGFGTGLVTTIVAVLVGLTAAYFRGRTDDILTLLMNLFLVIPGLPLLIALSVYLQPGTGTVILALSFTGWAYGARIIRAQALSVREKEFVAATLVAGESDAHIIFREILPNLINVIVGLFLGATIYGISAATALAFLGLTSSTEVSWGTNLFFAQNGQALMLGYWWVVVPPGLCVAIVAFGLSLINYGMDEVTNPRLRAEREVSNVLKNAGIRRGRATPVVPRSH